MGCTNSKTEKDEALSLCRERKRFIKKATDSRFALAAAHVSYIQSLRSVGISLRRYAEADALMESSQSISDKTPSHSSYPSPSPSHHEVSDSPLHNESPPSPHLATVSYMRSTGNTAVTVRLNPLSNACYLDDEHMCMPIRPPPPPPANGSSWDFFDTRDNEESFSFAHHEMLNLQPEIAETKGKWGKAGLDGNYEFHEDTVKSSLRQKKFVENSEGAKPLSECSLAMRCHEYSAASGGIDDPQATLACEREKMQLKSEGNGDDVLSAVAVGAAAAIETSSSENSKIRAQKISSEDREDPSEFITHRAKDFLSSIKDIEHRFFRASESGREVSRMLEANKIRVRYSEAKGKSPALAFCSAFQLVCCAGQNTLVHQEAPEHGTKVISWKRTASSHSSSSRNPLAATSKEDDGSGSDFCEEFCMIAGSHSSTLDRLYAWERKLYDEVKASECIRTEYDKKCEQLRRQFAKDQSAHVIDKTRSTVKDLHSRIRVAIHSVDSIAKRIEKIRDEELYPQLVELIQGLVKMWKSMLECHHSQYITISLAYHSRNSTAKLRGENRKEIVSRLQQEMEYFGLSFTNWIESHTSYVESLNGWLQNCILQPIERSKSRRSFSPRRVLPPPIFVLFREWSAGIKALPSYELSQSIKTFFLDLHRLMEQTEESPQKKQNPVSENNVEPDTQGREGNASETGNMSCIHAGLTNVLDGLTKFSEASLKMCEDLKQKSEAAKTAYNNWRPNKY